ncbi:MAG: hypothetical protein MUF49_25515 [Oculatellaceae cyanobacterium Prado106]|jgi:hypothetical protein|nr:hypothetical protein [Oculatellaceae cyanobacterium Prado106]
MLKTFTNLDAPIAPSPEKLPVLSRLINILLILWRVENFKPLAIASPLQNP